MSSTLPYRVLGLMVLVGVPPALHAQPLPARSYVFDAGAVARVADDALPLSPEHSYSTARGYGWTTPPGTTFDRPDQLRSRDALLRDGVGGRRLAFRADVPPGAWHVSFWMDAGLEDSSTVTFTVNGKPVPLRWQAFLPPAEPRTGLQEIYRWHQHRVDAGSDGVQLTWQAGADSVRLLGVALFPAPFAETAFSKALDERLAEVGRYRGTERPLQPLLDALAHRRAQAPEEAYAAYWHQQVAALALAERYFVEMRGWEWATDTTGLGLFSRYHQAVMLLDGLLAYADPETYPLYERALWQRARALYWLGEERHGPHERAGGRRDLAALYRRHPGDTLLAMYNGEAIDLPDACDALPQRPQAPTWAVAQRETLCRLRHLARWWTLEQQAPNGEFGGKLGDDVELLRWWTPLLLVGDTTARLGWQRLADGVWQSPKIEKGYFRAPLDVEHAAEPIADTAPQLLLVLDDPVYLARLRYSADYFVRRWTVRNEAGRRYFRTSWFGAERLDERPPRNRDVEMNTRATKAVRYYAWATGDEAVLQALHEWAQGWTYAASRTDKGKPYGILPASIRAADEALNGDEPTWHIANMFWPYFDWAAHGGAMMLDQLLATYTLTADETLLEPLFAALELVRRYESGTNGYAEAAPGTAAWAAQVLREEEGFWRVAGQWRLLIGDERYDDLILRYGTPYVRYRITGDERHLTPITGSILKRVRYNTPLFTSEVFHTDRVYVSRETSTADLKAMLTGGGSAEDASPYLAVSWEDTPGGFTALVDDTGTNRLGVRLFLFEEQAMEITLRLWQATPGAYVLRLTDGGAVVHEARVNVARRGHRVRVTLPPGRRIRLHLTRTP